MIHEYIGKLVAIERHDKSTLVGLLQEAGYVNDMYKINILKNEKLISIDCTEIKNIYRIQEKERDVKTERIIVGKENKVGNNTPKSVVANKEIKPIKHESTGLSDKRDTSNINNKHTKEATLSTISNLVINKEEMFNQLDTYGPHLNQFCSVVAQNIYYFQRISIQAKSICLIIRDSFCSAEIVFELIRLLDCNYDVHCDVLQPSLKYLDNLFFLKNLGIKKAQSNFRYDLLIVASDKQIDISSYKAVNYICMYNPQQSINYPIESDGKKYTLIYGPKPPKNILKKFKDQQFVYIYGTLSKNTYKSFKVPPQDGNCFILL